jgi:hypothetical protein
MNLFSILVVSNGNNGYFSASRNLSFSMSAVSFKANISGSSNPKSMAGRTPDVSEVF